MAKLSLMTRPAQDLLHDVLSLPEPDQLAIVCELLAHLDGPADPDRDEAWLAELDRRHSSEAASLSSETELGAVQRRLRAALHSRGR